VAGSCQATCATGLATCPSGCANLASDESNCGACGNTCDGLSNCTAGACVDPFSVPRLCSQLPADAGIPNDGGFVRRTVFAFGRSDAPLPVRCGVDGGTWLELPSDGGLTTNFARRATGGARTTGPDVVTRYQAVRIDYRFPNELLVSNTDDRTFAVSTGSHTQGNSNNPSTYTVTSMPYGTASACVSAGNPAGTANINLIGLPVAVTRTNWALGGFIPAGVVAPSSFNQVLNITGGGYCGDHYPSEGVVRFTLCTAPALEACDKQDNNCDGVIDNLSDGGFCPDAG
jgi:hypothetical protein